MADILVKSLEQENVQLRNQLHEKDKELEKKDKDLEKKDRQIEKLKEIRGMTLVLLFSPCHQS